MKDEREEGLETEQKRVNYKHLTASSIYSLLFPDKRGSVVFRSAVAPFISC